MLFSVKSMRLLRFCIKFNYIVAASPKVQITRGKHTLGQDRQLCSNEELSDFVELDISGQNVKVHESWLRHHCKCADCFAENVNERNIVPNSTWLTSKVTQFRVLDTKNELHLEWADGHKSQFNLAAIKRLFSSLDFNSWRLKPDILQNPVSGKFKSVGDPLNAAVVPYQEFMESEQGVARMLGSVLDTGFGVVSNVDGLQQTKLAHNRISHPIRTIYGEGVTVLSPDQEHNDASYSTVPLPLHTDTSYFTEPMGLQSFHILSRSGTGGQNCLSDGFLAAKLLYQENPELYQVLCDTPLEFQYLDEGCHDFRSVGPTLLTNPVTGRLEQVRYNPRHITIVRHLPHDRIPFFYYAFVRFTELLNENMVWIQLEPGTILWMNNWRILHGRNGFTGYRSVASAYFPRSDWLSRARVLGLYC